MYLKIYKQNGNCDFFSGDLAFTIYSQCLYVWTEKDVFAYPLKDIKSIFTTNI